MRNYFILFLCLLFTGNLYSQKVRQETIGDQSPAVIAENIHISYGIPPNITFELIKIYEEEGMSSENRNHAVKSLIKKYKTVINNKEDLSEEQKEELGIKDNKRITSILNYDIFMSTKGYQSPTIYAPDGYVKIWYGIPPGAFKGIWHFLEKKQLAYEEFGNKLQEQIEKFKELEDELASRIDYDQIAAKAKNMLDKGNLEEAELILEEDAIRNNKQAAYRNHEVGKVKELSLKYHEATEYFMLAAALDKQNHKYIWSFGNNLQEVGRYNDAIEQFKFSIELLQVSDSITEELALCYNNLGMIYEIKGDFDQAVNYLNDALEISLHFNNKEDSISLTAEYNNIGMVYKSMGNYKMALNYLYKALDIWLTTFKGAHPYMAMILNNLGITYNSMGEHDKALSILRKARTVFMTIPQKKNSQLASILGNLGSTYLYKGQYDQAMAYINQALNILLDIFGDTHPSIATYYNNIGGIYAFIGNYNEALNSFKKALRIGLDIFGENHRSIATYYNNIGRLYISTGKYDQAMMILDKALNISNNISSENHSYLAHTYNNLGNIYNSKGEYDKAIGFYKKALNIDLDLFDTDHPKVAIDYNNISTAYLSKEDFEKATEYQNKALRINIKTFGNNHPNLVRDYNNLGGAYIYAKEYDQAIAHFNQSLVILLNTLGDKHPDIASVYSNLGGAYQHKREYDIAISYFEKALKVDLDLGRNNHPSIATTYNNLGNAYMSKGEYDKAIESLDEAYSIIKQFLPMDHPKITHLKGLIKYLYSNKGGEEEQFRKKLYLRGKSLINQGLPNQEDNVKTFPKPEDLEKGSWNLLLQGKFLKAELTAKEELTLNPSMQWLNKNLAHSLLFQENWKQARSLYDRWRNVFYYDGRLLYLVMLEDLSAIESAGFSNRYLKKARKLLKQ